MIRAIQNRTNQWWQPKAGNILAIVFLAAWMYQIGILLFIQYIFPAFVTIIGIGLFGHFINDWADKENDGKAGKKNLFHHKSVLHFTLFISLSLAIALIPWGILPFNNLSLGILVAEFLLFLVYSFQPIRLKEKRFLALVTDALYAHALPTVLAFHTFTLISHADYSFAIYTSLFCWQFFVGLYNVAIHQFQDFENDLAANCKTWVTGLGKTRARSIVLNFIYIPQLISFVIFLEVISYYVQPLYFTIPTVVILAQIFRIFKLKRWRMFLTSTIDADFQFLNINYHHFLPYWHLALLSIFSPYYVIVLIGYWIVMNLNSTIWFCKKFILPKLRSSASLVVNYSIFYFRIVVLWESPAKARREYHLAFQEAKEDYYRMLKQPGVVIANNNLNKYTETFVNLHKKYLEESGYYLHTFYGGYLPSAEAKRGSFLKDSKWYRAWLQLKEDVLDYSNEHYHKEAIKNYLVQYNIRLVIAEFGLVGADIAPLCNDLKIPLIVTFYGYDAHHTKFVETAQKKYQYLFDYSSCIVGVSKDIIVKLKEMGACDKKLFYLPCAVDLKEFRFTDHSKNQPVFLAVGRFAETKSPHLTILAFYEVLKKIPEARLRMIGKDGGGELFEACHILVKALGIQNKVDFLGILSPKEVEDEMRKARVFVQHSITTPLNGDKEGTPVAIMEAMASGLPVVATRHAGIAEIIENGTNGFLVEEYDYLSMAEKMITLCHADDLAEKIGRKASESIFNNKLIAQNKEIFIDLVQKNLKSG